MSVFTCGHVKESFGVMRGEAGLNEDKNQGMVLE